jgi:hypothetical protein
MKKSNLTMAFRAYWSDLVWLYQTGSSCEDFVNLMDEDLELLFDDAGKPYEPWREFVSSFQLPPKEFFNVTRDYLNS